MFKWTKSMTLLGTLAVATGLCLAQEKTAQKPVVKETAIQQTSPISGKEMFTEYCAPCHGTDAKGTGPAASAMKAPPTDLTQLAKKQGGPIVVLCTARLQLQHLQSKASPLGEVWTLRIEIAELNSIFAVQA